jgi:ABC-type transport system involved in cytochrome c biogenesis permease component
MTVLPIVGRELVVAARRAATYWTRFSVAAVALAILGFLLVFDDNPTTELGQDLFMTLGIPTLGFCMLAGVFITADSLSVEKREGTLGLLFLTDLKGYDVVLGKLAAHSVHAVFGLLAVFPVLAMPLLTGGVSGGEFWRTLLVFVCTLYLSLSVGMIVSAASQEGRQAMAGTFATIVSIAGVLPLLWVIVSQVLHRHFGDFLLWPNPAFAYYKGFDDEYLTRAGRLDFWRSLGVMVLLATACILAASVLLPRSWQKTPSLDSARKRRRFGLFGKGRKIRRRRALQSANPFYWLVMGDRAGQSAFKGFLVLLFVIWTVLVTIGVGQPDDVCMQLAVYLVFGMHLAAKVMMATESGRRFNQDRQSGALELLLVTPLPVEAIVAGQRAALWAQFRRWIWALSLANILTFAAMLWFVRRMHMRNNEELGIFTEILLGGTILLWLDFAALSWLGMWKGLKAKKHSRAVLGTLGQVIVLPWVCWFFFLFLAIASINGGPGAIGVFLACWFLLGAVIDGLSIAYARKKLARDFRAIVARRYEG